MVVNGGVELTSLKAKFGADIRRTALRHSHDLTHNDLVLMLQRIFHIDPAAAIQLKYKDSDGDLVSLTSDEDVLHAVQSSEGGSLFVHVFSNDDSKPELAELEKQLEELQVRAGRVLESLRAGSLFISSTTTTSSAAHAPTKPTSVKSLDNHGDFRSASPLSPRQNIATIQPSLQQQVFADGGQQKVGDLSQEEEIPLDNSLALAPSQQLNNSGHDFAPPPPPSSAGDFKGEAVAHPPSFGPPPTGGYQAHPPVPQQPEYQAPPSFGPPPTGGIPSFPQSQAPPPPPTQQPAANPSAPPPQPQHGGGISNFPSFYSGGHEATPTPPPVSAAGGPPPPQFYPPIQGFPGNAPPPVSQAAPPAQFNAPPQGGYAAAPTPPSYGTSGGQQQQFGAPPASFTSPPANNAFGPPPTSFAPPPVGGPMPGYGGPGQPNPFGPRPGQPGAYRSSPYHHQ